MNRPLDSMFREYFKDKAASNHVVALLGAWWHHIDKFLSMLPCTLDIQRYQVSGVSPVVVANNQLDRN